MHVTAYKKYFNVTPEQLSTDDLATLVQYFELLNTVENPMVSLLIPVYRAKETLVAHMFSLVHLKTIIPYEVIFIDNNADTETRSILDQLGAKVVKQERQGITHARQKGLESARGEIVCTMDPDSIYDPYYIDKMTIPFYEDTELVINYTISKSYENDFQLSKKMQFRNWLKVQYFRWKLSQKFTNRIKYIRAMGMAIRKEALLPIGYRTDLKAVSGCDDGILAMEMSRLGKFKYIPIDIYTALPPPREPGRPFPFCNERFLKKEQPIQTAIKALDIEEAV